MTDKQKEAIETLFHLEHVNGYVDLYEKHDVIIKSDILLKCKNATKEVLNLIQTQQAEIEKREKMINSIKEYAQQEIDFATEDIEDYIDDDREGNKDIIGELKEWREHWKDIIRIMNNEKTYIDFEYKVIDTNVGERKSENGN